MILFANNIYGPGTVLFRTVFKCQKKKKTQKHIINPGKKKSYIGLVFRWKINKHCVIIVIRSSANDYYSYKS